MRRARHVLLLMFLAGGMLLNGQYTKEYKRIFTDADYLYETAFYEEAFNRYNNLLTLDPGNHNILFHCGACCLNIPGRESQSITYLEQAVNSVSPDYKDKNHKETNAPPMALFMLGQAYHLNYEFDRALETYQRYLDVSEEKDPLQLAYTKQQIEASRIGAEIDLGRPEYQFNNVLDHFDEDLPSCTNPVISGDGNTLIFLVDYPADKKIMMTLREGELWTRPRVINSELGMVGETYPVSLSYDGKDLYLAHHYYSHADIFISHLDEGRWGRAEELGYNINGRTSETHASISKDGSTLYFTSDVRGGEGSFDIYVSRKDENGEWGVPKNLGPQINTMFEEHTPFISANDSILFFASQGHASLGGMDIYYSVLHEDGSWGKPINMGYPVSTTNDDDFFNPGWNELEAFYATRRPDDPSAMTINSVLQIDYPDEVLADHSGPDPDPEDPGMEAASATGSKTHPALGITTTAWEPSMTTWQPPARAEGTTVGSDAATRSDSVFIPGTSMPEATGDSMPEELQKALEPENTDEIEMVLNDLQPEAHGRPDPEPETVPPASPGAKLKEYRTAVPFEFNAYELSLAAELILEQLGRLMEENPDLQVTLTGHADARGSSQYNHLLSLQRAGRVADYLEARGVDPERVDVEGVGENTPLAINSFSDGSDAPLGRYLNRQVKVVLKGDIPADNGLAALFVPAHLTPTGDERTDLSEYAYTIQLKASYKAPVGEQVFEGMKDVKEHRCSDGYYRYTTGNFRDFGAARLELERMERLGFKGAFIQTREWYMRNIR